MTTKIDAVAVLREAVEISQKALEGLGISGATRKFAMENNAAALAAAERAATQPAVPDLSFDMWWQNKGHLLLCRFHGWEKKMASDAWDAALAAPISEASAPTVEAEQDDQCHDCGRFVGHADWCPTSMDRDSDGTPAPASAKQAIDRMNKLTDQYRTAIHARVLARGDEDRLICPLSAEQADSSSAAPSDMPRMMNRAAFVSELYWECYQQEIAALATPRQTEGDGVSAAVDKIAMAYGIMWHVNCALDAPPGAAPFSVTPERGAYEARKVLRDMLTNEQRGLGINAARDALVAASPAPTGASK